MNEPKKLFLLDAMALIYRAYFAFSNNPRINSKGQNTSAVLGFANALLDILKNQKPTHIGVAFDTHAPTVRHDDFAEYKANREKMPEDLAASIPFIVELIKGFNIPILSVDGYEADDVIGTLAKRAEKAGFTTFMMTPDKDFGQLVSENIFMYKPARMGNGAEVWGIKEVCERYQLENPLQMIDLLGLWGDASDNIPGVPGIGEKTAIKLIAEYGSIENLLDHTDELKGKLKENLERFTDQALQSKSLATIILDVPIEFNPDKLIMEDPDFEKLKILFEELEFRNYAARVEALYSPHQNTPTQGNLFSDEEDSGLVVTEVTDKKTIQNTPHQYHLVSTKEEAQQLAALLGKQNEFCFDTETTGVDANNAELVGMSFAFKAGEAWYVPVSENYHEALETVGLFKKVIENPKITKIGQNIKFDASMLNWYEVKVAGRFFDTMIAHYLIQPDMRHNMDVLSETYLNYKPVSIETLIGKKGKNQGSMRDANPAEIKEYAAEDADITLQLKEVFEPMLVEAGTKKLFDEIEMPLVPVLASMEAEGVKLDVDTLVQFSQELETQIGVTQAEIFRLADTEFNIASPKQMGEVLFEKLAIIDKPKKTKTGQYATGEDELLKLAHRHPIIERILEFRSLSKLKSTYVDALPALVNPRDGRIHTSYNQAVAATGRLSSNNPNLQNIPIRTELGREIRKAFIPRNSDYVLMAADYSQIELRIIAHLSDDKAMIHDFSEGVDIHTATASRVYNMPLGEVTRDMRRNAKTVNFGIIYGISAFGLSERLGIPRREAADIISSYFEKYPGVKKYMDSTIAFAKANGYVETIMGRRRYLNDINSGNATVRGFAERNAINAPIQGSSADMIKIAMISIYNEMVEKNLKTKMILQVHDELVFDVHREEVEIMKILIEKNMKQAMKLSVPVEVDINIGENWLEAH
ncbi:MAG: DNA polymerase I [Bacteroidetes bacterium HGW-Bacteroidetes-16]|jgi:DNA polymerase-1|nr:MAG: DNA polymerase I [Bacteroidetes bacterium HGW-Bacteroidetes-16]